MKNNDLIQITFTAEELTVNHAHLDALLLSLARMHPNYRRKTEQFMVR